MAKGFNFNEEYTISDWIRKLKNIGMKKEGK